jgi:Cu+-exporting ATPase
MILFQEGTINTTGILKCKITAPPGQTTLDAIIELVKQAQTQKPPVQRLADRISAIICTGCVNTGIAYFFN